MAGRRAGVERSANVEAVAHFGRGIDALVSRPESAAATSGSSPCKSPASLGCRSVRDMARRRPIMLPRARVGSPGGSQRRRCAFVGILRTIAGDYPAGIAADERDLGDERSTSPCVWKTRTDGVWVRHLGLTDSVSAIIGRGRHHLEQALALYDHESARR